MLSDKQKSMLLAAYEKAVHETGKKVCLLTRTSYEKAKSDGENVVFIDITGEQHSMEEARRHFLLIDAIVKAVYNQNKEENGATMEKKKICS